MTVNVRARDGGALLRDSGFRLRDGRRLAYCEYGARDGVPAFFFHGWPGSRLNFAPNHAAAADAGVRGIAVDRPGSVARP